MRLRISVTTAATQLPWHQLLPPGKGLAYGWLAHGDEQYGRTLHDQGLGPFGMAPFGYGAPVFAKAPRQRGVYAVGGPGFVEFGSPVPQVVDAWVKALSGCRLLDWGGVALRVGAIDVMEPPVFSSGVARFRTVTPVVMKGSGRGEDGARVTRQAHLLPHDQEFPAYFAGNLRRKMQTLGLGDGLTLEAVLGVGPKRGLTVKSGARVGATVDVVLSGTPQQLQAVWSWGLGQANASGFGWIG